MMAEVIGNTIYYQGLFAGVYGISEVCFCGVGLVLNTVHFKGEAADRCGLIFLSQEQSIVPKAAITATIKNFILITLSLGMPLLMNETSAGRFLCSRQLI